MRYDHQWHRAQARAGRGRGWENRTPPQERPRGPNWLRIGAIAIIGLAAGLTIARGISDADRSHYDRLLSSVDIAPPDAPSPPRG
jgi:hypothetical protein